jgi:hypothetical protein
LGDTGQREVRVPFGGFCEVPDGSRPSPDSDLPLMRLPYPSETTGEC